MGCCVSSLLFDLRPNYGGGNEEKVLLQKVPCMHCCVQCPQSCSRPLLAHASAGDSWTLTGKSASVSCGVTAPFSWVLCIQGFVCASKSLFPQSCVSSGGSMMGLMVTSSKRAYATPRSVAAPVGLEAKFQQYVSHELPDVQAGFRKSRGTRDQIANICWIIEKAREFQKNIYFCFIDYAKAFDCVDHNKLWKILNEMGIPDHLICLLRNLYAGQEITVRTGHRTTDWFQIGKGCILSPCLFNLYQSTSYEIPGWMKQKLESRLPGEISIISDMQMTPPRFSVWQKTKN